MNNQEYIFRISELIAKQYADCLTDTETVELDQWLAESQSNRQLYDKIRQGSTFQQKAEAYQKIQYHDELEKFLTKKKNIEHKHHTILINRYMRVAAIFSIPIAISAILYFTTSKDNHIATKESPVSLQNVRLTLANGQEITLDSNAAIKANNENGIYIESDSSAKRFLAGHASIVDQLNTIAIPHGSNFFMQLSDGTKVWLNTDSKMRFPSKFTGNSREVYLDGEAYFEVTKDTKRPFIVKTEQALIKVLGTSFNVNSYFGESTMTTTLNSGSVEIETKTKNVIIAPGDQLTCSSNGNINIKQVDASQYSMWRNNRLIFNSMRFEDMMTTLKRYYDIEVTFKNKALKDILFTGDIQKYDNLRDLLDMIELTSEAKFNINGKTITVN